MRTRNIFHCEDRHVIRLRNTLGKRGDSHAHDIAERLGIRFRYGVYRIRQPLFTEKLAFAAGLAESLVFGRVPDISVLLEQIRSAFDLDDICVFTGNNMDLILSCSNASSRNAAYLLKGEYTSHFSGDGLFAIDNVNELEGREDDAFRQLTEENIGGAMQYLMTDESLIKGMVSFCYVGRFKKWSVSDMNYFAVLGRLITSILKKQAFI